MIIAVLAGLGGMLGWGLADFFAKKTIDVIGDVTTLIWAHVIGTAIILAALGFEVANGEQGNLPSEWRSWIGLIGFGGLQAAVYLFMYRGFGKGQVAVLAPLFASFAGLVALFSVLLFREPVTLALVVALLLVFTGVMALNLDLGELRQRRLGILKVPGFTEIATATLLATLWTLGWDQFVSGRDWLAFAAAMYVFMTISLLAYAGFHRLSLGFAEPGAWKFLTMIGICEVGAYIAVSWGYEATLHTSIVALVSGACALPTIFLAKIFLKEQTTRLQTIGGVLIVTGIVLLGIW